MQTRIKTKGTNIMSIRKTVKRENAHAIYASADGAWKWYVLKTYATPAGEAKNNYARWFCLVTSPFVGDVGEMGDTYIADIKRNATLESSTPEWRETYGIKEAPAFSSQRYIDSRSGEIVTQIKLTEIPFFDEYDGTVQPGKFDYDAVSGRVE